MIDAQRLMRGRVELAYVRHTEFELTASQLRDVSRQSLGNVLYSCTMLSKLGSLKPKRHLLSTVNTIKSWMETCWWSQMTSDNSRGSPSSLFLYFHFTTMQLFVLVYCIKSQEHNYTCMLLQGTGSAARIITLLSKIVSRFLAYVDIPDGKYIFSQKH